MRAYVHTHLLVGPSLDAPACTFVCVCAHTCTCSSHVGTLLCAHVGTLLCAHVAVCEWGTCVYAHVGMHMCALFIVFLLVHGCVFQLCLVSWGGSDCEQRCVCVTAEPQGEGSLTGAGSQAARIPIAPPRSPPGTSGEALPFQRDLLPGVQLVLLNKHHWLPPSLPSGLLLPPCWAGGRRPPSAAASGPQITCSIHAQKAGPVLPGRVNIFTPRRVCTRKT